MNLIHRIINFFLWLIHTTVIWKTSTWKCFTNINMNVSAAAINCEHLFPQHIYGTFTCSWRSLTNGDKTMQTVISPEWRLHFRLSDPHQRGSTFRKKRRPCEHRMIMPSWVKMSPDITDCRLRGDSHWKLHRWLTCMNEKSTRLLGDTWSYLFLIVI